MYHFLKDEDVLLAKLGGPNQMRDLLRRANDVRQVIESDFAQIVRAYASRDIKDDGESLGWDYVIGFTWDCEKSPIGLCIYNHYKDRAHDSCVFCHDPAERK